MSAKDNPSARPVASSHEPLSSSLAASLAAHTSDFVGVIDVNGVALFMNRSVRGADTGDVEGKPLEEFSLTRTGAAHPSDARRGTHLRTGRHR